MSATGVRPDSRLASESGVDTEQGRIVVNERMHTSVPNVYAAGDVALAYNVTAGRRIASEHWRDATEQGRIAGTVAAGYFAAWRDVPEFSCAIGRYDLTYRGWGTGYDDSRLTDNRDGFTVSYRYGHEVVGELTATASRDA